MTLRTTIFAAVLVALACILPASASAITPADCNLVVSPTGDDNAAGTDAAPLRTSDAAVQRLSAGQTVCFHAGTYQTSQQSLSVRAAGVTVTSYPGETATLLGSLRIERTATGATVEDMKLDGKNPNNLFNPLIYADNAVLRGNEITNEHTTNCVHLAHYYDAPAPANVVIEDNNIHGCGSLPSTNQEHGIYAAASRNLTIRNNLIWDNTDRGIQLYTDVEDTHIYGNVIDDNGEGIIMSGDGDEAASGTVVEHNLITNSDIRHNVESFFPSRVGTDNVVRDNCIYGASGYYAGRDGSGIGEQVGFSAVRNIVGNPHYADPKDGNFTIPASSPCAGVLDGTDVDATDNPVPTVPVTDPTDTPPDIEIDLHTNDPRVPSGAFTTLTGSISGAATGHIWILVKHHSKWHVIGRGHRSGNGFRTRVWVAKTARYKARVGGAAESNSVRVAAVTPKHKHKH
jgi:parallel beta-helix repeat protein